MSRELRFKVLGSVQLYRLSHVLIVSLYGAIKCLKTIELVLVG